MGDGGLDRAQVFKNSPTLPEKSRRSPRKRPTKAFTALSAETGKRLYSNCGQKKGVTKEGKIWSETWGKDDLLGECG